MQQMDLENVVLCAGQEESGQAFTEMYARETPLVSVLLEEIDQEGLVYTDTSGDTPGACWSTLCFQTNRQKELLILGKAYELQQASMSSLPWTAPLVLQSRRSSFGFHA